MAEERKLRAHSDFLSGVVHLILRATVLDSATWAGLADAKVDKDLARKPIRDRLRLVIPF